MDRLKAVLGKNQQMVRKEAPITIESTGLAKLSKKMEKICRRIKEKNKI